MYQLCVENALGELYDLTNMKNQYDILSIQGLTVPKIKVNTKEFAGFDGSIYNSSKVGERNIVINIMLKGDIEASRQRLYRIFSIKQELTLYFRNKYRRLKINGYVESIDGDLFVQREQIQISLICPGTFFEAEYPVEAQLSEISNGFQLPLKNTIVSISDLYNYPIVILNNPGDVTCGAVIEIDFLEDCRTPKITNLLTSEFFEIDDLFWEGDKVTICTIPGKFYVKRYYSSTKTERSILDTLTTNSKWFEIAPGKNIFKYENSDGSNGSDVNIKFTISPLYGGV